MISVYIDDLTVAKLLMDSFMTNPFARLTGGNSPFLFSIFLGRVAFVQYFLAQSYVFRDSSVKINIPKLLNKSEKIGYNNALHLAVTKERCDIIELLLSKGIQFQKVNYMNWKPFEMSKKKTFMKKRKNLVTSLEEHEIIACPSLLNPDIFPRTLYGKLFI
jgi:ankyrin repeat protein